MAVFEAESIEAIIKHAKDTELWIKAWSMQFEWSGIASIRPNLGKLFDTRLTHVIAELELDRRWYQFGVLVTKRMVQSQLEEKADITWSDLRLYGDALTRAVQDEDDLNRAVVRLASNADESYPGLSQALDPTTEVAMEHYFDTEKLTFKLGMVEGVIGHSLLPLAKV